MNSLATEIKTDIGHIRLDLQSELEALWALEGKRRLASLRLQM